MPHRIKRTRARRRGVATVEAAVLLPIVTLLVLGVCELSWYVYCSHVLNSAARQAAAVDVRMSTLTAGGAEDYQVQNLSPNEEGRAIRVTVSVDYGEIGLATDLLGLKLGQLSGYAVMRRQR